MITIKYVNTGQMFAKAAEKYTEAIDLAPKVPTASSQLVTLYNNRGYILFQF